MMCYRDKTYCDGDGCRKFHECPRAITWEVLKGSERAGIPIARFTEPSALDCYVPPDGSEFEEANAKADSSAVAD